MRLLDLPEDVHFLIYEFGLGVDEAVALEQTCKNFYALAQTTQFWLIIAKSLSENHPLPLPPFHLSLHKLSRLELKRACIRHHKTMQNLFSSSPKVMKRRTLVMSGDHAESNVYHFAFLPGGKYVITILLDGTFSCWDYSAAPYFPDSETNSPSDSPLYESQYGRSQLPDVPLATYHSNQKPLSWNFQSFPDKSEVLVSILTGEADDWGEARLTNLNIHILRLNFVYEGYVRIDLLALNKVPFPCGRIFIQNDIVCSSGVFDDTVFLFFNNWRENLVCVIDTAIREDCWKFDCFALKDNSLVLYHETGVEAIIHRYLEIPDLIRNNGSTPPSLLTPPALRPSFHKVVTRRPDSSQRLRFEVPTAPTPLSTASSTSNSSLDEPDEPIGPETIDSNDHWFTTHPWNTPNPAFDKPLSILSTSRALVFQSGIVTAEDEDGELIDVVQPRATVFRTLTHHWLDPSLLTSTSPSPVDDQTPPDDCKPVPGFRRWVHHLPDVISMGIISSELVCPGSDGTHLFWLCDGSSTGGGHKIQMALIPSPKESPTAYQSPSKLRVRDLDLGPELELSDISTMDIDDAHGVFGLGTYSDGMEQRIHMLYY
ncbi:hypothetical protein FRC02_010497 [Tulasnella sp. 418]|nr:hypothetical protein FRC02_010497 [Tulasnella sp. 418]